MSFSRRKHEILKIAKDSKIVIECEWKFKISQNVHFFLKRWQIFWKKMKILKIGKSSKFVVECDWISKTTQNVLILGYFRKKNGFSEKTFSTFYFLLLIAYLSENETERVKILKTFIIWFFLQRKNWFFRKETWFF